MSAFLSACFLSLGLAAPVGDGTPTGDARVLIAQETEPESETRTEQFTPNQSTVRQIRMPPSPPTERGVPRMQPIRPTIQPRGMTGPAMTRPGLPQIETVTPLPRPPEAAPDRTRRLRGPEEEEPKASAPGLPPGGAKGGTKIIEDEKCRPLPPHVRVKMNFNEAEVLEIVQWISKQTCKNFIIGDSIRGGKITILSNTPVTANEAYRAFLSALNVNNMTVIQVGRFYKIQMKRDAVKDTIPTYIGDKVDIPSLDLMITRVIQLKYIDANTINGTVKQLTTKDGDSYPYPPTNTLIISDTGINMYRLMEIINQLDTPLGQEEIRVIQINYAVASELSQTLGEIFGEQGKSAPGRAPGPRIQPMQPGKIPPGTQLGGEGGAEEGISVSKIIADQRTNKLILVASSRSFLKIQELIDKLDVPIPGEGQIQVLYLQHADAEELASTLTALAQGTASRPKTTPRTPQTGMPPRAAELFQGEVKVTADKATNSLVIVANQSDYKNLLNVLKKLDIPRRQVFVEAVIMEVNIDAMKETGFAFHTGAAAQIAGETVPLFFGTQFKIQGSNFNSLVPNISLLGFMSGLRGPDLAGEESILGSIALPSFGVMLQALQTDSNVNVLSTPHILTSDNEEAEIKVGENIPIPAGYGGYGGGLGSLAGLSSIASQVTGTTGQVAGMQSPYGGYGGLGGLLGGLGMGAINRQEVGLTLKIKPQINEGNIIRMDLEEELSEVKDTSNPLGPTTTKRSAKTVVEVQDQQTVVVGGLIRDKVDIGETKVPVLGDIPVLGWFFRSRRQQKTKTNLLLFLTPYVIEGPEDFREIFERKIQERREFLERFYGGGPDYQAFVDFRKKHGPLADIHINLRQELKKVENGGPGLGAELVITPQGPATPATGKSDDSAGKSPKSAPEEKKEAPVEPQEHQLKVE